MITADTNVLVRLFVNDDERQSRRAHDLFAKETVLLATTVILECEWVLRSAYGFKREAIAAALRKACGLPRVVLREPGLVNAALSLYEQGFTFADALHLSSADMTGRFATFDRALIKLATRVHYPVTAFEP